ncbi:MAG: agmatinase [Candidatus Geothermarchaeales archaeon]
MSKDVYPYVGIPSFMSRTPIKKELDGDEDVVIVGVPFDGGVVYKPGTRFGPQAIRRVSMLYRFYDQKKGLFDVNKQRMVLKGVKMVDWGDVEVTFGNTTVALQEIYTQVKKVLNPNSLFIFLGGDHSITFPLVKAFSEVFPSLAVLHLDSHMDLLERYGPIRDSHSSPFRRIIDDTPLEASDITLIGTRGFLNSYEAYSYAKKEGEIIITMEEFMRRGVDGVTEEIIKKVSDRPLYVSVDIDALDAPYAVGTGVPEPGGFSYVELSEVLSRLFEALDVKGMDLVEVSPLYDVNDITARVAVELIIRALGGRFHEDVLGT